MKLTNKLLLTVLLIAVVTGIYRATELRTYGFAPQFAVAIFSGFLFKSDKKWAFALPLLSMLVSDVVYQVLYITGNREFGGFYGWGQLFNYALIALISCFGFFIKNFNPIGIAASGFLGATFYFLVSNFEVWIMHGGYQRPKTFEGLIQCMNDGVPFYKASLAGTGIFSLVLFGSYYLILDYYKKEKSTTA